MKGRMGLAFLPAPELHHLPQFLTSRQHCNCTVAGSNPKLLGLKMCTNPETSVIMAATNDHYISD